MNRYNVRKMNLESKYTDLCNKPSDINEHLPTLCRYASECDHVTEAGVRFVVSTFALMMGRPQRLVSIDIIHPNEVKGGINDSIDGKVEFTLAEKFATDNEIDFQFILGSTLELQIEKTDLLFLDTLHCYDQLSKELKKHHKYVSKYIILHDTQSFAFRDENEEQSISQTDLLSKRKRGLWMAITEFLYENPEWKIFERYYNNNGLTVLKKNISS